MQKVPKIFGPRDKEHFFSKISFTSMMLFKKMASVPGQLWLMDKEQQRQWGLSDILWAKTDITLWKQFGVCFDFTRKMLQIEGYKITPKKEKKYFPGHLCIAGWPWPNYAAEKSLTAELCLPRDPSTLSLVFPSACTFSRIVSSHLSPFTADPKKTVFYSLPYYGKIHGLNLKKMFSEY